MENIIKANRDGEKISIVIDYVNGSEIFIRQSENDYVQTEIVNSKTVSIDFDTDPQQGITIDGYVKQNGKWVAIKPKTFATKPKHKPLPKNAIPKAMPVDSNYIPSDTLKNAIKGGEI